MGTKLVNWLGAILVAAFAFALLVGWIRTIPAADHGADAHKEMKRALLIESPASLGVGERPPVEFDHQLHVDEASGDDGCLTCHELGDDGYLEHKVFTVGDDTTKEQYSDAYHDNCFGCHNEEGKGPVKDCGACHVKQRGYELKEYHSLELDLRQHNMHVEALEEDCGACHHKPDPETGELVHVEGEEASCRDCHNGYEHEDAISYRDASHKRCVTCHWSMSTEGSDSGPHTCDGCHDAHEIYSPLADMSDVPRLVTSQDDAPFIVVDDNNFPGVPFNHKAHEQIARNCRVCHHQSMNACDECHTLDGSEAGSNIKLADAFHDPNSDHSCIGCHEIVKKKPECASCHSTLVKGGTEETCDVCHSGPLPSGTTVRESVDYTGILPDDLPDVIEIGILSDQLEPVEFPHKMIVTEMAKIMGEDRLGNVFHGERPVVCASCHHESPMDEDPPSCARCHGEPFDERTPGKPGLKSAYHLQCIGCHQDMNIGNPRDCSECHKDENAALPVLKMEMEKEMQEAAGHEEHGGSH